MIGGIYFWIGADSSHDKNSLIRIPLKFIPLIKTPIVQVSIQNSSYSLDLDLGCSHSLCLSSKVLDKIPNKQICDAVDSFDYQGGKHHLLGFVVSNIRIGNYLKIDRVIAREEDPNFLLESSQILPQIPFLQSSITSLYKIFVDGRAGWPLFSQVVCCFDFKNHSIYLGNTPKEIFDEIFTSNSEIAITKFDIDENAIIIYCESKLGIKRYLLDSGSTYSLATSIPQNLEIRGTLLNTPDFVQCSSVKNLNIDGILGVDFFQSHLICIDFPNQTVYIQRHKTS